jgi:hypothetical protein
MSIVDQINNLCKNIEEDENYYLDDFSVFIAGAKNTDETVTDGHGHGKKGIPSGSPRHDHTA